MIPAWNRQLNGDGTLPSGINSVDEAEISMLNTLQSDDVTETKRAEPTLLIEISGSSMEEDAGAHGGSAISASKLPTSEQIEIPNEWNVFRLRGPPAKFRVQQGGDPTLYRCHHFFDLKKGVGPHSGGATDASSSTGNTGGRKVQRELTSTLSESTLGYDNSEELKVVKSSHELTLIQQEISMARELLSLAKTEQDKEKYTAEYKDSLEANLKTIKRMRKNIEDKPTELRTPQSEDA